MSLQDPNEQIGNPGSISSIDRVAQAAQAAGLKIQIRQMPESTKTAAQAALACGCGVSQIVKSLVFQRTDRASLVLLLVAGDHQADLSLASRVIGADLVRADPKRVRHETGFAIGGVAPLGHLVSLPVYMDGALLEHDIVWAAAGAPNAVFSVSPRALLAATTAVVLPSGVRQE